MPAHDLYINSYDTFVEQHNPPNSGSPIPEAADAETQKANNDISTLAILSTHAKISLRAFFFHFISKRHSEC